MWAKKEKESCVKYADPFNQYLLYFEQKWLILKKNFLVHSSTILQLFVWTPPGWSTAMQISPCQVLLWVREWLAPNLVISEKTNISFYSSKSWWPHPVSSRHGGWHGTTCWVLLEHILRCHDHNCDPREYSCPLYCNKYVMP